MEHVSTSTPAYAAILQAKDRNRLSNRFHLLAIDNTKKLSKNNATPRQGPKVNASANTRKSTFEPQISTKEDPALFAIFCCLNDLHDIEKQVLNIWTRYAIGEIDLVTASLTTNAAFELGTQLEADLRYEHPSLTSWEEICLSTIPSMKTNNLCQQGTVLKATSTKAVASPQWMYADAAAALYYCVLPREFKIRHQAFVLRHPDASPQDIETHLLEIVREEPRQRLRDCLNNVRGRDGVSNESTLNMRKALTTLVDSTIAQLELDEEQPLPVKDHLTIAIMQLVRKSYCACTLSLSLVFMCHLHEAITQILKTTKDRAQLQLLQSVDVLMSNIRNSAQNTSCACARHREEDTREFFDALHVVDSTGSVEMSLKGMSYDTKHGTPLRVSY